MIKEIEFENKKITIMGTAHISKKNAEQVREIILEEKPEVVCVELDRDRFFSLLNKDKIKKPKFSQIFKSQNPSLFFISYFLSGIQEKVAKKYNVQAGTDMMSAITSAKSVNAKVALIDRDVNITLNKLLKELTFKEKMKIIFSGFFIPKKDLKKLNIDKLLKDVEEGKEDSDMIAFILKMFTDQHQKVKKILIDERDTFMAKQIQKISAQSMVVVVGAGHVEGIVKNLEKIERSAEELMKDSSKIKIVKEENEFKKISKSTKQITKIKEAS